MSSRASLRVRKLTRAEQKVLADISLFSDDDQPAALSSRKLTETTGLGRTTVRRVLDRLNALHLIKTRVGTRTLPSEHTLLCEVPVRPTGGHKAGGRA